jgi:hypothetical protein
MSKLMGFDIKCWSETMVGRGVGIGAEEVGGGEREFNEGRRGGVISWFHFVAPEERTMLRCLTMPGRIETCSYRRTNTN